MLYIATVHHQNPLWPPIQLRHILLNTRVPFEVYAVCNGMKPGLLLQYGKVYKTKFRSTGATNHAENLNFLAREVGKVGKANDILVFMDSDAFPIVPEFPMLVADWLNAAPLVAVRRQEGPSPLLPHPCFCATTVGFWQTIKGDWLPTPWRMSDGTVVQDTGSKLYKKLYERNVAWAELNCSNAAYRPHSTCFTVYGNVVYHHGAGSRGAYPDVHSEGSTCLKMRQLSPKILRLIEDHNDFYKLFTEGKYMEKIT